MFVQWNHFNWAFSYAAFGVRGKGCIRKFTRTHIFISSRWPHASSCAFIMNLAMRVVQAVCLGSILILDLINIAWHLNK